MRKAKSWRRFVQYPVVGLAFRCAAVATGFLPASALPRLGAVLGAGLRLHPRGRRLIRANLRVAFPDWSDARLRQVARTVPVSIATSLLEFLWSTRHVGCLARSVDVSFPGFQEVLELAKAGTGAVMLTPHLGSWEITGQAVTVNGGTLCAVASSLVNPWVDSLVKRTRQAHGLELLPERGAARNMLRCLRAGKPVGVLMDQNTRPHEGGVFADFFGLPVAVSRAPAALARRTGVPVRCAACVRENGGRRLVMAELERPVTDYDDDAELAQDMLRLNEELIRQYPEQYLWTYRRWRYIPEDCSEDVRRKYPSYSRPYISRTAAGRTLS